MGRLVPSGVMLLLQVGALAVAYFGGRYSATGTPSATVQTPDPHLAVASLAAPVASEPLVITPKVADPIPAEVRQYVEDVRTQILAFATFAKSDPANAPQYARTTVAELDRLIERARAFKVEK